MIRLVAILKVVEEHETLVQESVELGFPGTKEVQGDLATTATKLVDFMGQASDLLVPAVSKELEELDQPTEENHEGDAESDS